MDWSLGNIGVQGECSCHCANTRPGKTKKKIQAAGNKLFTYLIDSDSSLLESSPPPCYYGKTKKQKNRKKWSPKNKLHTNIQNQNNQRSGFSNAVLITRLVKIGVNFKSMVHTVLSELSTGLKKIVSITVKMSSALKIFWCLCLRLFETSSSLSSKVQTCETSIKVPLK